MFRSLLVPLDGSAQAAAALPLARTIAQATGGSITLLRVPLSHAVSDYQQATSYLEAAAEALRAAIFTVQPTPKAQVAAAMHMEPDRLRQIRLAAGAPASLDVPVGVDSDLSRAETLTDEAALAAMQSIADADDLPGAVGAALEELPEREREVLRRRYGLATADTHSLAVIGKRLGVTRERAHQIEGQALHRLRRNAGLRRAMLEHASA